MQKIVSTLVSAAASGNGMGAALTSTGAAYPITANGAGDQLAHQITIKNNSITDHSLKTVTIVGTDENDRPLTETHAMPGASATITSVSFFKTVTSITPSASTGADTFDIGWAATSQSKWERVGQITGLAPFNMGFGCTVISGTPNYSLKYSYDGVAWFTHSVITGKTASADGSITSPIAFWRFDFTAAGSMTATALMVAPRT